MSRADPSFVRPVSFSNTNPIIYNPYSFYPFLLTNAALISNTISKTLREVLTMPRVTRKGQVTIPQQIRSALRIKTGDEIIFEVDAGKVVLKKNPASAKNFKKYIGYLSHLNGKRSDDIVNELRGNADEHSH